jgi:integrase/recombinase XerD
MIAEVYAHDTIFGGYQGEQPEPSRALSCATCTHEMELPLRQEIQAFLVDRQSRGLSKGTIKFYSEKLRAFLLYTETHQVGGIRTISPQILRDYLLELTSNHTPGGVHAAYRALRAFLRWWEEEEEPRDWKNPIAKVRAPRVPIEPLEPVSVEIVKSLLKTCRKHNFTSARDKAILMLLLDTGCRASEFVAVDVADVNMNAGEILVRCGKGGKPRMVYFNSKSRRALLVYFRFRADNKGPLWVSREGKRLKYAGLREVIRRRAKAAGLPAPSLHSFRRAFALGCLRLGMDPYSLQRLMGHADLSILRRYLAQTDEDVRIAHERSGPVDHLL